MSQLGRQDLMVLSREDYIDELHERLEFPTGHYPKTAAFMHLRLMALSTEMLEKGLVQVPDPWPDKTRDFRNLATRIVHELRDPDSKWWDWEQCNSAVKLIDTQGYPKGHRALLANTEEDPQTVPDITPAGSEGYKPKPRTGPDSDLEKAAGDFRLQLRADVAEAQKTTDLAKCQTEDLQKQIDKGHILVLELEVQSIRKAQKSNEERQEAEVEEDEIQTDEGEEDQLQTDESEKD